MYASLPLFLSPSYGVYKPGKPFLLLLLHEDDDVPVDRGAHSRSVPKSKAILFNPTFRSAEVNICSTPLKPSLQSCLAAALGSLYTPTHVTFGNANNLANLVILVIYLSVMCGNLSYEQKQTTIAKHLLGLEPQ